ncbi:MAG: adenylosuccinate lyase [Legionellales bacterium]|nr:adenylosuccinate lyase [Legionellales bacterium]
MDNTLTNEIYVSPLSTRYASCEMSNLFSSNYKYKTWRKIWLALAESQKELGLPITDEQISQLKLFMEDVDIELANNYETELQHDVMAHVHAYGDQAPLAKPILHLGATSCLITDNTEILIIYHALNIIKNKLIVLINQLANLANKYKSVECLSYTHFQPAQPTTIGKRITVWLQDFLIDLEELDYRLGKLKLLGIKGATGTQASFLDLFDQDSNKVKRLEELVIKKLGIEAFTISGQTYTRKQDIHVLDLLSNIAASSHKFSTDFRLLVHIGIIDEPRKPNQVGSTAMLYKRNPILSERICALSRFVISLSENPKYTLSTQWLERSLDDSANKRLVIPESFLSIDAILELLLKITYQPSVYLNKIDQQLSEQRPFLLTEKILNECVKAGRDRQLVHNVIQKYCLTLSREIRSGDACADELFECLGCDSEIPFTTEEIISLCKDVNISGMSVKQVDDFLQEVHHKLNLFNNNNICRRQA